MSRALWSATRVTVLDAYRDTCQRCTLRIRGGEVWDCIALDRSHLVPMHRSCRLKHDAKTRVAKGIATRRARRAQLPLPYVRRSKAA